MSTRLWEYRAPSGLGTNPLVYYFSSGVFQAMACNQQGEILLHIIEETDTLPDIASLLKETDQPVLVEMGMHSHFSLVPKVFRETEVMGMQRQAVARKPLDESLYLQFEGASAHANHIALPLYLEAKKHAAGNENYVLAFVHAGLCFLVYFKHGVCELANAYPVSNESEILYFCMAVVKKSGVDVRRVKFDLLANNAKDLIKVFDRFVSGARMLQLQLPYSSGEYPPYAAESYLLYQFLTCELPAEH